MKHYAPYLLYQLSRFGALSVPQMLQICDGKCARSALYRALGELVKGDLVYPILNPATRTRGYYATRSGREAAVGKLQKMTSGVRAQELDHTIQCADILLEFCRYENITGVTTHFEISVDDARRFCHGRIPDGIVRLTRNDKHFEFAVEIESSMRNTIRVSQVLDQYWQTLKRGMECYGLIVVAMSPAILKRYKNALEKMAPEYQSRVRLLLGRELSGIRAEAFGEKTSGLSRCLDLTRTTFLDEITYSPVKAEVFLAQVACTPHTPRVLGPINRKDN